MCRVSYPTDSERSGLSGQKDLNPSLLDAVDMTMADPGGHNSNDQRPNLWEELNRPRSSGSRIDTPPPPPPAPTSPALPPPPPTIDDAIDALREDGAALSEDGAALSEDGAALSDDTPTAPSNAAVAMKRVDSQHLLLVGGVLFIIVTIVALRGLGASSNGATTPDEAARVSAAPEPLPSLDEPTVTQLAPAPPTTTAGPTAMGLPAQLLDGPQSSVYRLYRTALGREPDRTGFQYWADQVRAGTSLETLARQFVASEEFGSQFVEGASADERTALLLGNAFGPPADEGQLRTWLDRYRGVEGAALLLAISEADETVAYTGTLR
jgi:hypothetical protein